VRAAVWELVPGGGAVAGSQIEPERGARAHLDLESPLGLAGDLVGQHVEARHHVAEPEGSVLVGPKDVTLLLRRAVGLADEVELQPHLRLTLVRAAEIRLALHDAVPARGDLARRGRGA